jgi:broad-specificity NMP kinase
MLVTGPAGIGKSTLCWEIGAKLEEAQIAHAIVETDELDRVYPKPTAEELERLRPGATDINAINLAAIWSTYRALGHSRLIMSGVIMHPGFDRRWILAAIPDAEITLVRLQASESTLTERLERRETGSGMEEQLQRTLRQARRMATESGEGSLRVPTDGKTPAELADTVLRETGWSS